MTLENAMIHGFLNRYEPKSIHVYKQDPSQLLIMFKQQTEAEVKKIEARMQTDKLTTAKAIQMPNGSWDIVVDRKNIEELVNPEEGAAISKNHSNENSKRNESSHLPQNLTNFQKKYLSGLNIHTFGEMPEEGRYYFEVLYPKESFKDHMQSLHLIFPSIRVDNSERGGVVLITIAKKELDELFRKH